MAKEIIKAREKAREIFFETDRNILLYGGEEVLNELLIHRKQRPTAALSGQLERCLEKA